MEQLHPTLLDLWRLAACHQRLDEVIAAIAAALRRHWPFEYLVILAFDQGQAQGQARLWPAASHGLAAAGSTAMAELAAPVETLRGWCLRTRPLQGPVVEVRRQFPGLIPEDWRGELLLVGLVSADEPQGLLLLGSLTAPTPTGIDEKQLLLLSEPLAPPCTTRPAWGSCWPCGKRRRPIAAPCWRGWDGRSSSIPSLVLRLVSRR